MMPESGTVYEKIPLKDLTTFKLGGPASYFIRVRAEGELSRAIDFARERNLPIFILGGGSNVVVSDAGFSGLVIKIEIKGLTSEKVSGDEVRVIAGAGLLWDELVAYAAHEGLWGIENLSFIPGTVGAAPIQNIGAYGTEVKDSLEWVEVFDRGTQESLWLSNQDCHFSYRNSIFKQEAGKRFIVLRVAFRLKHSSLPNLFYKDVAAYFGERRTSPSLSEIRNAMYEIRSKKFPDLKYIGTAGSFFKNPIISMELGEQLKERYPDLPVYPAPKGLVKISLAWILDHVLHLRGVREGNVGMFERQPIVLVGYEGATAHELQSFAKKIIARVFEVTSIVIEPEIIYVGNFKK